MSARPEGLAPAEWGKHAEACAKMREAEEGLHSAMTRLKSAAMFWVRAEAEASGDRAAEALADIRRQVRWALGISIAVLVVCLVELALLHG